MTHEICFNCDGFVEPNMVHSCIKGLKDNLNRLHSNINLLLHYRLVERDKSYWEGFDACLEMIKNYFENCDHIALDQWSSIVDDINEAADLYKKDG